MGRGLKYMVFPFRRRFWFGHQGEQVLAMKRAARPRMPSLSRAGHEKYIAHK